MTKSDPQASTVWKAFRSRHRENRWLDDESLYSLRADLVIAIQKNVPGFFTQGEIEFEKDLAKTAGFGFFNGRVLGHTDAAAESLQNRQQRNAEAIDAMLVEEYRRLGLDETKIHRLFKSQGRDRQTIGDRKAAYVGWLVINGDFRAEVTTLRHKWRKAVTQLGTFPTYPRWPLFDLGFDRQIKAGLKSGFPAVLVGPGKKVPRQFEQDFLAFYRRWQLDRLLTWDWPVPMEPDLRGGMLKDYDLLNQSGFVVFVPWYCLRDRKLDLRQLLSRTMSTDIPSHLRSWFAEGRGRRDDLRYERLAWLFRFYSLALKQRYRDRLHRRKDRLDQAFGEVMRCDPDWGRKLRLKLERAFLADLGSKLASVRQTIQ